MNKPIICGYLDGDTFWFRIFGYGIHIKDLRKNPMLFSERNNLEKYLHIGHWSIKLLKGWHSH